MSKFYISYRGEFGAVVEAESMREALEKFQDGECKIEVIGDLWPEFFEVTDEGGVVVREEGWPELQSE